MPSYPELRYLRHLWQMIRTAFSRASAHANRVSSPQDSSTTSNNASYLAGNGDLPKQSTSEQLRQAASGLRSETSRVFLRQLLEFEANLPPKPRSIPKLNLIGYGDVSGHLSEAKKYPKIIEAKLNLMGCGDVSGELSETKIIKAKLIYLLKTPGTKDSTALKDIVTSLDALGSIRHDNLGEELLKIKNEASALATQMSPEEHIKILRPDPCLLALTTKAKQYHEIARNVQNLTKKVDDYLQAERIVQTAKHMILKQEIKNASDLAWAVMRTYNILVTAPSYYSDSYIGNNSDKLSSGPILLGHRDDPGKYSLYYLSPGKAGPIKPIEVNLQEALCHIIRLSNRPPKDEA
jgi:hypothetical protein